MTELIPRKEDEMGYESFPDGKILIFGDSAVKDKDILGCIKSLGIPKDRIELHLGYDTSKRLHFYTINCYYSHLGI